MKILRLAVFLLAAFCALVTPSRGQSPDGVSFDFFYDSLAPYGEWVDVGNYGLCWHPTNVDPKWTPYTDGYWAYTDAGWTWVSYEDFGGIVYHYGRWMRVEGAGWCWAPDYEWAPAWVSWRSSDEYVGWAPLPPWAHWHRDVGISVWADQEYDLGPGYYRFCHVHDFGAPVLREVVIDPGQNFEVMLGTANITNITYNAEFAGGPIIFNGGPDFAVINRLSAHPVPALKLVQNTSFDPAVLRGNRGALAAQTVGNQLVVVAPHVTPPANPAALAGKAKRVIAANVTKGWNGVKNPDQQRQLRQQIQEQTKGLTPATAHAHAVAAAELSTVPAKGDPHAKSAVVSTEDRRGKGKDLRTEDKGTPPATAGGAPLKPFNPTNEPEPKSKTAVSTKEPRGPLSGNAEAGQAEAQREQEQARMRAEQERKGEEKQAAQQQKQAAQQQQQAARAEAEQSRRLEEQQRAMEARAAKEAEVRPGKDSEVQRVGRGAPPAGTEIPQPGVAGHSKDPKKGDKEKGKDKDKDGN